MTKINIERITTLLSEGKKAYDVLSEYNNKEKNELLQSYKDLSVIKYHFIIIIESTIEICNHITSKLLKQAPETYSQCFALLNEYNLIDKKLSDKLSEFAKFRNLLVHLYWKADDNLVIEKLNELNWFDLFFDFVLKLIKEN